LKVLAIAIAGLLLLSKEATMFDTRVANYIFGVAFIAAGLLGFFPNPLVAENGIFAVNLWHNIVHILTGGVFLAAAAWYGHNQLTLQVMGAIYLVVALLGFAMPGDMMLGMILANTADHVLHLVFALVMLAAGFGLPRTAKLA